MILELKKIFYNIFKLNDHQFDVSGRRLDTQHKDTLHYTKCRYAECNVLLTVILNVAMAPTNVYASITKSHLKEKFLVTAKLVLFNPQVYRDFGQGVNLNKNLFL